MGLVLDLTKIKRLTSPKLLPSLALLYVTEIESLLFGAILCLLYTTSVQPQSAFTPVRTKLSEPVFLKVNTTLLLIPRFKRKFSTVLSNEILGCPVSRLQEKSNNVQDRNGRIFSIRKIQYKLNEKWIDIENTNIFYVNPKITF